MGQLEDKQVTNMDLIKHLKHLKMTKTDRNIPVGHLKTNGKTQMNSYKRIENNKLNNEINSLGML